MDVITYPCWDLSQTMLTKGVPGGLFVDGEDWFISTRLLDKIFWDHQLP